MDADLERRRQELEIQRQELEIMERKLHIENAIAEKERRAERGNAIEQSKKLAASTVRGIVEFVFYLAQIGGIIAGLGMSIYGAMELEMFFIFMGLILFAASCYHLKCRKEDK